MTASAANRRGEWPVLLISMPFADIDRPSIQLGLLKAIGEAHGFPMRTLHAGLDFAARVGRDPYRRLCAHRGRLIGDWLFSMDAFQDGAPDPDARLLDEFGGELAYLADPPAVMRDQLLAIRHRDVPAYLDDLVETIIRWKVRVVGFTCTFQQNTASFALARRLKKRDPDLVTVFGGANFDGEMGPEFVRAVDCIDYAVIGEGDVAFAGLLSALADGADPGTVPGVARRVDGAVVAAASDPPLTVLDDLPVPDYGEYFAHAEELGLLPHAAHRAAWIPFETARGCWWGAKHHCSFCGLNGTTMAFRAKSPTRVLNELATQAHRYRSFRFEAVDNILDPRYLTTVFPTIVDTGADYEFFYEVKANLSRAQLRLLARAGVRHLQPGLESLSSHVLGLMRKGVRAAQNVNLLRWARYYRIDVMWNLLWGFPGETAQDYVEQAAVMPHLVHLQPPASADEIWLERFSPLYAATEAPVPERSYRYVYPTDIDLGRAAYFFEYDPVDPLPATVYEPLRRQADAWRAAWQTNRRPVLTSWFTPGFLQIYDGRRPGEEATHTFEDPLAAIYAACSDRPITAAAVRDRVDPSLSEEMVREVIEEFARRGLIFLDGSLAVALAIPAVPGR